MMLALFVGWFLLIEAALCDHFRGGTMSWKYNAERNEVEVFRRTFWTTSSVRRCNGDDIGGSIFLPLYCDGICSIQQDINYCTDSSKALDYSTGERRMSYLVSSSLQGWFSGCCWPDSSYWDLTTIVNVRNKAPGIVNTSPVSLMLPVIRIQHGCGQGSITIPAEDADREDIVKCRWAHDDNQECGEVCQSDSSDYSLHSQCTLNFNSANPGTYLLALQIEDFNPVDATNTPYSSVPLQFSIEVYSSSRQCAELPHAFTSVTDGSVVSVKPNSRWTQTITATSSHGSKISEIVTASPAGLQISNLTQMGNSLQWYVNVSWSPDTTQLGTYIFCYAAVDNLWRMSTQHFIVLYVSEVDLHITNCSSNNGLGPCGQICNQVQRSIYCTCKPGYILLEDRLHCFGIPRDLVLTATESAINASWKSPLIDDAESENLTYTLTCSSFAFDLLQSTSIHKNAMLVNLIPFTNYSCCLRAYASLQSHSQVCDTVQTMEAAPSDPPSNVYVTTFSSTAVAINWYPPYQPNGQIIGSSIYVNFFNGTMTTIKLIGGDYRSYLLQNMQPAQEVGIQVSSSTNRGEGPRSIIIEGRTDCSSGTFYSKSIKKCTSQCECGEGQVKYYRDQTSYSTYAACVPVEVQQVGIQSVSSMNSIYTNSSAGTLAANVIVTYPLSLNVSIEVTMYSYLYKQFYNFDTWKYLWIPSPLDISNTSSSSVLSPTWSGWWSGSNIINISQNSHMCTNSEGKDYFITPINMYTSSSSHYQGEMAIYLQFTSSHHYWGWWYSSRDLRVQIKPHYNCPPLQFYDVTTQNCTNACACGLAVPKDNNFCAIIDTDWNQATFAHHTVTHQTTYNNPVIPDISTRLYFPVDDWVSQHFADYYFYFNANNTVNFHIIMNIDLQLSYSNYTTPATKGTDIPNVVLTLLDGTKVLADKGSASIVLDDMLSPLTKSCNRDIDSVRLGYIPFVISASYANAISSLGIHNFIITAQLTSTNRILDHWLQYFYDEMLLSITIQPGADGSKPPLSKRCNKIQYISYLESDLLDDVKFLPSTLNSVSDKIIVDDPGFPFGNSIQSEIYISSNGLISFGKPVVYSYPAKFPSNYQWIRNAYLVAPFWSFNDIRLTGSVSYGKISHKDTLLRVSKLISNYYNTSYNAQWMLAVQWKGVHPYPHGGAEWWGIYYGDTLTENINKENSYQAILTTDGFSSYAVFTYECGKLGWSGYWDGWRAVIGYNANGEYYKNHPASGYDTLAEAVSCQNKVCGEYPGTLVYNLSLPPSAAEKITNDCISLYNEDKDVHGDNAFIANISAQLEPCPCSIWQAWRDFGRFHWQFYESLCFIQRSPANSTTAVQQCCYSSWTTGGTFGALIKSGIDKGSMLLYHPRRNPDLYRKYDVEFKDKCCGIAKQCKLYNQRRPSDDCAAYQQPAWTWGWGDPHITTLDGRTYTFNGWGEYVILQYSSPSSQDSFTLQGRMVPVNMTTATQYSAFAFGNANYRIEIGVSGTNSIFYVHVDGVNISSELKMVNSTYNNSDETIIIARDAENSMSCATPNGVSITINNTNGALSFVLIVPPSWKGLTKGLLGNFNGNKSDEFLPRGETEPLPDSLSDKNIHWIFGQTWNVSQFESLFTYNADHNQSWQFYSHPNHVPVFADEIIGTEVQIGLCGNDSQCLYDLSQTNNTVFAMETAKFSQANYINVNLINNFPPVINGSRTFKVTLGQQSTYNFTVEDTDNITVGVLEGTPNNATLAGSNRMYTLNWTISNLSNASLTLVATDSFNATSIFFVQVQICACTNGGNCTTNGLFDSDDRSVVLRCDCPKAYDGTFCEKDRNGCLEDSCYPGVQCYDVPAPGVGITCGPCPSGYIGDGSNCADINECSANTSICQQLCTNIPGSYSCSCLDGYTMMSNGVCTDIDECMGVNECEQICFNTAGSYYCDCNDGFQFDKDSHRCTVINSCRPGHNCSDICVFLNNINTCFCSPGFALGADKKKCNDIDECTQHPCEQTCRNTIGSFKCSCATGFQLNADQRSCNDIDECRDAALDGNELCLESFECLNTIGSYLCGCPSGYQNRGGICQANIAPRIIGIGTTLLVKVGHLSLYNFSVMDDGDTYSVGVVGGIPIGANITFNKENYTFMWKVQQAQNIFLTFYAVDSLNATTQLSVQVLTCDCQNEGNCTLGMLNETNVIVNCECSKAYSGAFCEKDRNECLEDSCYTGVQCYDVPAPGVGITCGPCPNGYSGDGRNCADTNECELGTSGCTQLCSNTVGSYTCSCYTGYKLDADNQTCIDIDECFLGTSSCTQSCANTDGSYTCSCNSGYTLAADNHACVAVTTVNDTVSGAPLFTVPLWLNVSNPLNGPALCYQVEGKANKTFNLLSDVCTSVNAFYSPGKSVGSTVITQIGILTKGVSNQCRRIVLNVSGCTVAVDGTVVSTYQQDGIAVAKIGNRVRLSMPNCGNPNLVAWIVCEEVSSVSKLHFIISRGVNLRPTSHGIIGQFWNIPITVVPYSGTPPKGYSINSLKIITVFPAKSKSRSFIGIEYQATWDHVNNGCYYSGDSQGSTSRIAKPDDAVIEGGYADYVTRDLFSYNFRFNQFRGCTHV